MGNKDDPNLNIQKDNSEEEDTEDLAPDVQEAIGITKKKGTRPDPTDYISEFENPDLESENLSTQTDNI